MSSVPPKNVNFCVTNPLKQKTFFPLINIHVFILPTTIAGPKPIGKPGSSSVLDRSARISWPPSSEPVDEYEVSIKDPNGEIRTVKVPGNKNQVAVGQLTPETTYTTTVRSIKNGVKSSTSPMSDPFTMLPDGMFAEFIKSMYIFLKQIISYVEERNQKVNS